MRTRALAWFNSNQDGYIQPLIIWAKKSKNLSR
jgi:hypothetical protein